METDNAHLSTSIDRRTIQNLMLVLHQALREREFRGQRADHLQQLEEQLADALRPDLAAA